MAPRLLKRGGTTEREYDVEDGAGAILAPRLRGNERSIGSWGRPTSGRRSFYAAGRVIKLPAPSLQARGCGVAA